MRSVLHPAIQLQGQCAVPLPNKVHPVQGSLLRGTPFFLTLCDVLAGHVLKGHALCFAPKEHHIPYLYVSTDV